MEHIHCEYVRDWADRITQTNVFQPVQDDAFYRHVASCDTCRGALISLSLLAPDVIPPYTKLADAEYHADLAAFVDAAELAPGSEVALYPALWWHLLSCQDCAEEYRDLRAFAGAMRAESAGAPTVVTAQPARSVRSGAWIARLELQRDFLQIALPSWQANQMMVYRGEPVEPDVLAEEEIAPGFQATVGVRQESAEQWSIVVTIVPPFSAQVTLTLGDFVQRATLDSLGRATFGPVPANMLLAADGPALEITIQRDSAP